MGTAEGQNTTSTENILVIEDDALMRDAIAELLMEAGYAVRTAADGSAGLRAVEAMVPALVVTDIFMPGTSGKTVIIELKRMHPNIPIIAISGRFSSQGMDMEDAISLGAAQVLSKPFNSRDLLAAVVSLLRPASP